LSTTIKDQTGPQYFISTNDENSQFIFTTYTTTESIYTDEDILLYFKCCVVMKPLYLIRKGLYVDRLTHTEVTWAVKGYPKNDNANFVHDIILYEKIQSFGVGSHMMQHLFKAIKSLDVSCSLKGKLSSVDADTKDKYIRREKFYRRLNFDIHYTHEDIGEGYFDIPSIMDINTEYHHPFVKEVDCHQYLLDFYDKSRDIGVLTNACEHEVAYHKRNTLKKRPSYYLALLFFTVLVFQNLFLPFL